MTRALVILLGVLGVTSPAWAVGPVNPTTFSWTAPQTNTDGSNLDDLKEYQIDLSTDNATWNHVATTPALEADPIAGRGQSVPISVLGITQDGQYYVTVRACDTAGNCSGRGAPAAPFAANRVAPSAPGALSVQ